ncbi:MAG: glycosyltransferase family 2 protein [Chitinophagales bacterium]
MNPIISIIVPCFNQAQYLDECLQSVLEQTYHEWECIIVNDGSPDNAEEVAQKWIEKDQRYRYVYKENGGLSSARNAGINIAKGEYILPRDADDKISEIYIEECLKIFSMPDIKLAYGGAYFFGERNDMWNIKDTFQINDNLFDNSVYCSILYKKNEWERMGGYDENMKNGLEDWEFLISLLKNGGIAKKNNKATFYYRIKISSMINSLSENKLNILRNYIYNKHKGLYEPIIKNTIDLYNLYIEKINQLKNIEKNPIKFLTKILIKKISKQFKL